MVLVDSHCHLDCLDYNDPNLPDSFDMVLQTAKENGVKHFLCVAINLENFPHVYDFAKRYSSIYASVGVHPTEQSGEEPSVARLVELATEPKVIAIGETGLDYYWLKDKPNWQRERFKTHINAAIEVKKPLIVHSRDAKEDTIRILREHASEKCRGVMHCFTEDYEMATKAIDLGFYISFSGIVTFKNATALHDVARRIPLDSMLVETDSPYLAPVPYRGKTNQPGYTRYVAECIAKLRGESLETIATATTNNFQNLFNVKLVASDN